MAKKKIMTQWNKDATFEQKKTVLLLCVSLALDRTNVLTALLVASIGSLKQTK